MASQPLVVTVANGVINRRGTIGYETDVNNGYGIIDETPVPSPSSRAVDFRPCRRLALVPSTSSRAVDLLPCRQLPPVPSTCSRAVDLLPRRRLPPVDFDLPPIRANETCAAAFPPASDMYYFYMPVQ